MGDHCDGDIEAGNAYKLDEILTLLSRKERREVIEFCRSHERRTISVDELAEHVTHQRRRRGGEFDPEQIELGLYHRHIPRLAEQGVLDFDPRSGQVRYWGDDSVEDVLDRIKER